MGQIVLTQGFASVILPLLGLLSPRASALAEGLVELQVDLPPDVQRMFEEMCELEGVSQTQMLTRWIDARWEAMGYQDSDLVKPEELQDPGLSECKAESCQGERKLGRVQDDLIQTDSASQDQEMPSDEDEEEDAVPDIETWMRRYASSDGIEDSQ